MNPRFSLDMKHFKIPIGGGKKAFPHDIIYLKANANYSEIYLTNGQQLLVSTTLKKLESRFLDLGFFRTHRSSLINLSFVKSYSSNFEGGIIQLANNETIIVSRRKNKILRKFNLNKP